MPLFFPPQSAATHEIKHSAPDRIFMTFRLCI
jgi:hypothetical protein